MYVYMSRTGMKVNLVKCFHQAGKSSVQQGSVAIEKGWSQLSGKTLYKPMQGQLSLDLYLMALVLD